MKIYSLAEKYNSKFVSASTIELYKNVNSLFFYPREGNFILKITKKELKVDFRLD